MNPSAYSDLQLRIGVLLVGGMLCLLITTALLVRTTLAADTRTAVEAPALEEEQPMDAGLPLVDVGP